MELHVYDFDGTLFRSPDQPDWFKGRGWVVQPESLGEPCVPEIPGDDWWIPSTVSSAQKSIGNPDVWAILCTGRADQSGMRFRVPELLRGKGLKFDQVFLSPGGSTKAYKLSTILGLLKKHPGIETVHIWEDDLTNLGAYCAAVEAEGKQCVPHPITTTRHPTTCTEEEVKALRSATLRLAASLPRHAALRRALLRLLVSKKPATAVYTEVILDDPSTLRQWWEREVGTPLLSKPFAHHLTIKFKPQPDEVLRLPLGEQVALQIVGYAEDEHAQAVVVQPAGLHIPGKIVHVTLATDGANPAYSNELLGRGWTPAHGPRLSGVVGFFDGDTHRWDLAGTAYEVLPA